MTLTNLHINKQVLLTVVLLIFQHFTIVKFLDYDVTILLLLLPLWILSSFQIAKKFQLNSLLWFAFFSLYPLINLLTVHSIGEFLKTYLQFLLCIFTFLIIYNARPIISKKNLLKALITCQIIITIFLVIQYILVIILKQEWIYNPWGPFSWKYPLIHDEYNFYRMKGFYLEPSYVAFVTFTLFICRYIIEQKIHILNFIASLLSLFLIDSSFGFLAFFAMISMIYFLSFKGKKRIIFLLVVGLFAIVLSPSLIESFLTATKLNNLSYEGYSSAYTRWIFPINLVHYIFSQGYITGYGMGQLDPIISNFDLIIIESGELGVSNSLASLTIYFGIATVFILSFLIRKFWKGSEYKKVLIFYLIICLSNTGAFNVIEFFFTFCILPYVSLKICDYDVEYYNSMLQ